MKKTTSGFTIVELLIVIVVIGVLASISVVAFNGIKARALQSEKTSKSTEIRKALERFKITNDRYPGTSEIGGSAGATLIGMSLSAVTPSNSDYPNNGIEGGWLGTNDKNFKYMAWPNPDGSGFTCNSGPCQSFLLQYNDPVSGTSVTFTNPR